MNGFEDKKENEYASLSDGELVRLSRGGDSFATEYLLKKYKNLVRQRARTYFLAGADRDDLVQEGMIGLYKAVRDFDFEKNAAFKSFAELCIKRQIITAVKASTRKKHIPLNSYVSLSKPVFDDERDSCLEELLSEMNQTDPEEIFFRKENAAAMAALLKKLYGKRALLRQVGENAQKEIYISWESSVRRACARYEVVLENFHRGLYPPHDAPSDEFYRHVSEYLAAVNRARSGLLELRGDVQKGCAQLTEKLDDLWDRFL